jgi:DNA-directed RNA polymerase subunit RPC12/RpoP
MSRLYCKECKTFFDSEDSRRFISRDRETNFDNREVLCPFCNSDYIVEATTCSKCGKEVDADELENGLCEECRARVQIMVIEFMKKLSVAEQEFATECFNGAV